MGNIGNNITTKNDKYTLINDQKNKTFHTFDCMKRHKLINKKNNINIHPHFRIIILINLSVFQ